MFCTHYHDHLEGPHPPFLPHSICLLRIQYSFPIDLLHLHHHLRQSFIQCLQLWSWTPLAMEKLTNYSFITFRIHTAYYHQVSIKLKTNLTILYSIKKKWNSIESIETSKCRHLFLQLHSRSFCCPPICFPIRLV